LLATVRRWWRKTAGHRRKTPFLDIGLDENEAALAEVDVHGAGPLRADGGEEVLRFEAVGHVIKLFAVACEEYGAGTGTVADTDDVALDIFRTVGGGGEGLVVAAVAGGGVG
jgi:hypothetical protein